MGPEQAEWYFSVVTAQNVRTPHLVTVAVENAAALAEGGGRYRGRQGGRPMDRKDWKELFAPRILQRGLAYYREGAVEMLQRKGDVVNAVVLGRERYRVEIGLKGDEITDWSCDCPYASEGTPCKHMAAVFYGLDNADREEAPAPGRGRDLSGRGSRVWIRSRHRPCCFGWRNGTPQWPSRSDRPRSPPPNSRSSAGKDRSPGCCAGRRGAWVYRVRPGLGYDV